nr:unnamed protein product [Callosobruchus chinensis]
MDHTHWATVAKCSLCGTIPESAPLFQCSFQHPYCYDCIAELKRKYKGSIRGGATCVICRLSGVFQPSTINNGFLKKIKARPGIGRVCRYTATPVNVINGVSQNKPKENKGTATNEGSKVVSVESLFHLPSDQISKLIFKNGYGAGKGEGEVSELSKRLVLTHSLHSIKSTQIRVPILCPHNPCGKMVSSCQDNTIVIRIPFQIRTRSYPQVQHRTRQRAVHPLRCLQHRAWLQRLFGHDQRIRNQPNRRQKFTEHPKRHQNLQQIQSANPH